MGTIDHITNGEITIPIGGRNRTLKFGMLANKLQEDTPSTGNFHSLGILFWAGLLQKASINELPKDFSVEMAMEWMDEVEDNDLSKVIAIGSNAMNRLKNVGVQANALRGLDADGNPLLKEPTGKKH